MRRCAFFFTLFLTALPVLLTAKGVSYSVAFEGVDDSKTAEALRHASQLVSFKKRPPASINALRYRAESDLPNLIQVLHAHGYYEARIDVQIRQHYGKNIVVLWVDPGPRYELGQFEIHLYCTSSEEPHTCCLVTLEEIGVELGNPVRTQEILDAELKALARLSECGYPLAKIDSREVIVDGRSKQVRVVLNIKTGEKARFGPTLVTGAKKVKPLYIQQKLEWKEGEQYDSRKVSSTQDELIDSGLFSSVLITHEDGLLASGEIPLKIDVSESKHKSVNVGVSYQTVFGPGVTFGWANRNVGRMGRTFEFQGDITRISQTGVVRYIHPNFLRVDQDMIAVGEAQHEALYAYSMRSYSLMDRFERRLTSHLRGSLAFQGERLYVTESVHNGNFWLIEFPMLLRWSTANDLLNPTRGVIVEFTATPALNIAKAQEFYLTNTLTQSSYYAFDRKERIVFAQKITFGTIWSNGLNSVPVSERFLGGTEEDLRGYRYRTVSPLGAHHKPIGGRSAFYGTLETRFRLTQTIGLVPFFDFGSVWLTQWPTAQGKWYKSVGLGFRFFTVIAPFRVDLAFPLDRRKGIDPVYKVLVSIGQMF